MDTDEEDEEEGISLTVSIQFICVHLRHLVRQEVWLILSVERY